MTLGDRIAVLGERGRIEQLAPPLEIYHRPANVFVAEFIGMPRIDWFEGQLEAGAFVCADFRLALPSEPRAGGGARLGVRPHDLTLADPARAALRGRVELVEAIGATLLVHGRSERGVGFRMLVAADAGVRRGDAIGAEIAADRVHLFDAQTQARL